MISYPENWSLKYMPTHQVNLDSLILRQPFPRNDTFSGKVPLFKLDELHRSKMYFGMLRKPDFQRGTHNWNPAMIYEFVITFLDGGLIPSIIVWHSKSTNNVYVIDGAHRVSALIAYVNDDYGNGDISQDAWGHSVPKAQIELHNKTKQLIDNSIGSFSQLTAFGLNPALTVDETKRRRGKAISAMSMHIQTVDGDTALAEESFYKINSSSVAIDETELNVIRARAKPNAMATRVLISAGKGHKYWEDLARASEIEAKAAEGYKLLFGDLSDIGVLSPDIPRAGQPYSNEAFKMILDMVNIFNDVTPAMWEHKPSQSAPKRKPKGPVVPRLEDDLDGTTTLAFMERIVDVARLVAGGPDVPESLGLDQGVYAYGITGKIIPAAFLASLKFARELQGEKKLVLFSVVRAKFEQFLVDHKEFLNTLTHSKGSRTRSLDAIVTMYRILFDSIVDGNPPDTKIVEHLQNEPKLKDLKTPQPAEGEEPVRKKFSKSVIAAKVVLETIRTRALCGVCEARLPPSYRSKDHLKKQEQGGLGDIANLSFTHPFCNSAKDAIEKLKGERKLI
jgi:hypothetical protein